MKRFRILPLYFTSALAVSALTFDLEWLITTGSWNSTLNWTPSRLPGSTDSVIIDPLNGVSATVSITSGATAHNLTIGSNDTVAIANNQTLTLDATGGGSALVINNGGSLALNSIGNGTRLLVNNGTLTISGNGSVDLSANAANQLIGTNVTDSLVNQSTIQGAGAVGGNSLIIENQGTITALYSTPLILDPSSGSTLENSGTLQAASGGVLRLNSDTVANLSGTIHAASGGLVELVGVTVQSGVLSSTGTGRIQATNGSTISSGATLTTGSTLNLPNAHTLNLANTFTLDGTLTLNSIGNGTDLVGSASTTTIAGSGKISLSDNTGNRIFSSTGTGLLINQTTIEGAGQIGANVGSIQNEATIRALYANSLTLDPGPAGTFVNTGQLIAESGGFLNLFAGNFTNTGGQIIVQDGGRVGLAGNVVLTGGTLSSSGTGYFDNASGNTLDSASLLTGTDFRLRNATSLRLSASLSNAGTISLNSVGNATDLIIESASLTLNGGGVISLSANTANRVYGALGSNHLTNVDNTLRGSGQIGANQLTFTNQGIVEANLSGSTLTLDSASTPFANLGTFRAVNGGILVLADGGFDNTSGTIQALSGSTVRLSSASVTQGTVDIGPNAKLELASSSFDQGTTTTTTGSDLRTTGGTNTLGGTFNLNPGANFSVNNNSALKLLATGTYTLDGALSLNSVGNTTDLIISGGDTTVSGSGKIILNNNGNNRIYGLAASDRLILNGVNLEGGGALGLNLLGFVNQGVITANDPTALTIDPSALGFTNSGTLRANNTGTLNLTNGTFNHTGGFVEAAAGAVVQFSETSSTAGTLQGTGTLRTSGSNSFANLTLDAATTFNLANNTATTLTGTLQNPGKLSLTSIGNLTDLIVGTGGLTLSGGGEIQLGANSANRIYGQTASVTLTNANNTLHGAGQIGVDQLVLHNQSVLQADVSGQTLTVDLADPGLTNSGSLIATNGGTLLLLNSTIENQTGGLLRADSGASLHFSGVTLNQGRLTGVGSIRTTGNNTFADLTLDTGSTLQLNNNTSQTFSGTLQNSGTIELKSIGNETNFIVDSAGLVLSGGGTIQLNSHASNRIYGASSAATLTNADQTLAGYGQIGVNQLALNNQSTITADVSGQTLRLDTSNGLINSGQLKAENGGTLEIINTSVTNTSGLLTADSTSTLLLTGSTITGGTIDGPTTIGSAAVTFDSLKINSGTRVTLPNNRTLNLQGPIENQGTLAVSSIGNLTNLVITGNGAQLSGSNGVIELGSSQTRLYGVSGTTNLTLGAGQTLRGTGQLGVNQLELTQSGTIEATASTALVVDLTTSLTNQGTISALGSGGIQVQDPVFNQGDLNIANGSKLTVVAQPFTQLSGRTELQGGSLTASSLQINGGNLQGRGTITGSTTFSNANLSPHAGLLAFSSSLTLDSATTLRIEISGPNAASEYGNLSATDIFLDGQLFVRFGGGFENSILVSDTFAIIAASNALTGAFQNITPGNRLPTSDGFGSFAVNYDALGITLSDFQPVPEPSTATLLLTGLGFLLWPRRRRQANRC